MNRINEVLKEQGRSQAYISKNIGKSVNTISNWCRNVTQPTLPEAKVIADLLSCELNDLLIEKGEKN